MRKNIIFTVAAVIMGLAVIFWARSSLLGTSSDARSTVGMSFYPAETVPYLPLQAVQPTN
jgi:hypothetical protein